MKLIVCISMNTEYYWILSLFDCLPLFEEDTTLIELCPNIIFIVLGADSHLDWVVLSATPFVSFCPETRNLFQYITIGALKLADTKEYCGHNALFMNKYSKATHSHLCVSVNGSIIWLSITVLDLNGLRFHRWLAFIFLFINWLFSWIIYSSTT